ncbi:MAG: sigma factor [Planctomycetaceae bacterium]
MAEHGPDPDAGDATAADGPRGARSAADGDRDDHETFVRLLLEHEPRVRGFIRGLVPTWHDVDEVVQQASLVAWRKFNEFDRGTNFGSWLMVIARFEALKHRRRVARGPRCLSAEVWEILTAEADPQPMPPRRSSGGARRSRRAWTCSVTTGGGPSSRHTRRACG